MIDEQMATKFTVDGYPEGGVKKLELNYKSPKNHHKPLEILESVYLPFVSEARFSDSLVNSLNYN
jgi:hypothetical protein